MTRTAGEYWRQDCVSPGKPADPTRGKRDDEAEFERPGARCLLDRRVVIIDRQRGHAVRSAAASLCIAVIVLSALMGCGDPAGSARAPAPRPSALSRPQPGRHVESPGRDARPGRSVREPASPPDAMSTLALIVEEPDALTRAVALETLARDAEAVDAIAAAMVDPDESIRERAQQLFDEALERR